MNVNAAVRRTGALMGLILTGLVLALAGAGAAAADGGGSMDVTDTHHISIHDYQMSFNEGAGKVLGVVATPGTSIPASFHQLMAAATKAIAELAFMPYKAATHLDILTPAVKAAEKVSTSISSQFGEGFLVTVVGSTALLTVVIFALRNHKGQAWHHIAVTLACMGVGVVITLPVGEAAHLLKQASEIAEQSGVKITGGHSDDPTAVLVDAFVRQPFQRWQYGHDLDSVGCGAAWDQALNEIKAGTMDVADIKNVPLSCPGGVLGEQMHAYTMNPGNSMDRAFMNPLFMLMVFGLIVYVVLHIIGTAFSALVHAALIKPGLITVGTSWGQSFLARNLIDGYAAAISTCLYLLGLFVVGTVVAGIAQTTGNTDYAQAITMLVMAGCIVGIWKVHKKARGWKNRAATAVLPRGAPDPYGAPSKAPQHARRMALQAGRIGVAERRSKAMRKAVQSVGKSAAEAAAPEVMIPAAAAGVAAQHILHAAHHYQSQQAASYQAAGGAGGSAWGATGAAKGGGVAGGGAMMPAARTVNHSGSGGGGRGGAFAAGAGVGAAANARSIADRGRQKRAAAAQNAAPAPQPRPRPGAPAPLRTSGGPARTPVPVGAGIGQPQAPSARPGAPTRVWQQPAGGGVPAPSPGGPRGAAEPPAQPPRTGSPAPMTRGGTVNTARDAARRRPRQ